MKKKLIICVDGLGKDMLSKENSPFLFSLSNNNPSRLKTLFAFTGIEYDFFSGQTPDKTNIWLEFSKVETSIFNNPLLRFFSFNSKIRDYLGILIQLINKRTWFSGLHNIPKENLKHFDTSTKIGLWKLPFFQERNFVFYKWPFFITKQEDKEKRRIIFKYESDAERMVRLLSEKGRDIYYTQLMGVDKTTHKFGKKSLHTKKSIRITDKLIEKYSKEFLKENKGGEVVIWSDHGFADIQNFIDLEKIIQKNAKILYFLAGTTASFWFKDKKTKDEFLKNVKDIKNVNLLDKKTAKKYKIPFNDRYGEVVLFLKKGNYFFPNHYQKKENQRFVAMHGYPENSELDGFIVSSGRTPQMLKMDEVIKFLKG